MARSRAASAAFRREGTVPLVYRKDPVVNPNGPLANPGRRSLLAAAAGSMLLFAGCSSSSSPSSSPTTTVPTGASALASAVTGDMITIQNFAFSPATLTVAPGTTVTVTNKDSVTHTVTATDSAKSFDTGDIPGGSTVTFKAPATAGTYAYICTIHTYMHGTLIVR